MKKQTNDEHSKGMVDYILNGITTPRDKACYEQGYAKCLADVEKIIEDIGHYVLIDIQTEGEVKGFKLWLKQELVKESK